MTLPKACDVIRHKTTGDVRVAIAVTDDGCWVKRSKDDKVWVPQHKLVASSESKWTQANDWEIVWPGHGWIERDHVARTQKEIDEQSEGGAV